MSFNKNSPNFQPSRNFVAGTLTVTGSIILNGSPFGTGSSSVMSNPPVTDNAIVRWDGTTGLIIQDSPVLVDDLGVISTVSSGSAEIYGTSPDGGASIGVIMGTSASYTSVGSKLVSIKNGSTERKYISYDGSRTYGISNYGGFMTETYFTDVISITGSTLMTGSVQIPNGAVCYGVGARVLTSFQTASVMAIGISSSATGFTEYWGSGLATSAGTTNATGSLRGGWVFFSSSVPICISSSILQDNAFITGSVRVEARYLTLTPPTS